MKDENPTGAVIRRLGGAAAVAREVGRSHQAVREWVERDRFPPDLAETMLSLCIADNLPTDHPQLSAARRRRNTHAY